MNTPASFSRLGLYIHIPFCPAKCHYCAFYSIAPQPGPVRQCLSAIRQELSQYLRLDAVTSIYIGGGSPTCLPDHQLVELIQYLNRRCPRTEEVTVECNPGQVSRTKLARLHQSGATRLSIGAQSFQPEELDLLGRRHRVACIRQAVTDARQVGFTNIGLDLISGIPHATLDTWKHSLQCAVALGPQHISAYGLSLEPGTDLYCRLQRGQITPLDEDTDRAMYELALDFLEDHHYRQYEISNFAQTGFECQHNLGYWLNQPYLGIGPAAASYWQGQRRANVSDVVEYVRRIQQTGHATQERQDVTASDRVCETAVLNLRLRQGIDLRQFRQTTGRDAVQVFAPAIASQGALGLLDLQPGHLRLTREALPIADSVLCEFSCLEERLPRQTVANIR